MNRVIRRESGSSPVHYTPCIRDVTATGCEEEEKKGMYRGVDRLARLAGGCRSSNRMHRLLERTLQLKSLASRHHYETGTERLKFIQHWGEETIGPYSRVDARLVILSRLGLAWSF